MTLEMYLAQLGVSVSSSVIYDLIKSAISNHNDKNLVTKELASKLDVAGADIKATNIIEFLAQHGDIRIVNSKIYAPDSITMASTVGTSFSFGQNSESATNKTAILAQGNSQIVGHNGAKIVQGVDGSIRFYT